MAEANDDDPLLFCSLQPSVSVAPFAVSMRLTPELLENLLKAVNAGEPTSVKFGDSPQGNVILVGGKKFTFTSFEERGCDVYARLADSPDDLKEVGRVLRKCNVQRQLDQNEAMRVKQRCEESELVKKARKSEAIDSVTAARLQQNPSRSSTVVRSGAASRQPLPVTSTQTAKPRVGAAALQQQAARTQSRQPVPAPAPAHAPATATATAPIPTPDALPASFAAPAPATSSRGPPPAPQGPVVNVPRVAQAVLYAAETGAGTALTPLRAALLVMLTDRPLTLKAIKKAIDEMAAMKEGPRGLVAPDGRVLKGAQRVVKEMAEDAAKNLTRMLNDLAQLKAPGRYHLKPRAEKEYAALAHDMAKPAPSDGAGHSPGHPATPNPLPDPKAVLATASASASASASAGASAPAGSAVSQESLHAASTREPPAPTTSAGVAEAAPAEGKARAESAQQSRHSKGTTSGASSGAAEVPPATSAPPAPPANRGARIVRVKRPATTTSAAAAEAAEVAAAAAEAAAEASPAKRLKVAADATQGGGGEGRAALGMPKVRVKSGVKSGVKSSVEDYFAPYEVAGAAKECGELASEADADSAWADYNAKYPVYRRLHADLTHNAKVIWDLEATWRATQDSAERAAVEAALHDDARNARVQRMVAVFRGLHAELAATKRAVIAYEERHHLGGGVVAAAAR